MNPIQKYPHIIELSSCILNMFILMFLCSVNLWISLGTCSTPKELKFHYLVQIKQPNVYLRPHIHQGLLHMLNFYCFR